MPPRLTIRKYAGNEYAPYWIGVGGIRRDIEAEQVEALERRDVAQWALGVCLDLDSCVLPALLAFCEADEAYAAIADTDGVIAERLGRVAPRPGHSGSAPSPVSRSRPSGECPSRKRRVA
jgi:hypothetical protein